MNDNKNKTGSEARNEKQTKTRVSPPLSFQQTWRWVCLTASPCVLAQGLTMGRARQKEGRKEGKRKKEQRKRKKKKENSLRQFSLCHKLHDPRYHSSPSPFPSLPSCLRSKNDAKGAVNTSATSLASSCGINDTSGSAFSPVAESYE